MGTLLHLKEKKESTVFTTTHFSSSHQQRNVRKNFLSEKQKIEIKSFLKDLREKNFLAAAENLSYIFGLSYSDAYNASLTCVTKKNKKQLKESSYLLFEAISKDNFKLCIMLLKEIFNLKEINILKTIQHLKAQK